MQEEAAARLAAGAASLRVKSETLAQELEQLKKKDAGKFANDRDCLARDLDITLKRANEYGFTDVPQYSESANSLLSALQIVGASTHIYVYTPSSFYRFFDLFNLVADEKSIVILDRAHRNFQLTLQAFLMSQLVNDLRFIRLQVTLPSRVHSYVRGKVHICAVVSTPAPQDKSHFAS